MDTQNATILIEGIEDTIKKVILKTAGAKFYFWKKKKDGQDTKAFTQFQDFNFRAGDAVEAAVKEEQRTFTNEKGKEITYMDRNIAFFLVQDNVPVAPQTPRVEAPVASQTPSSEHSAALKAYLQQLETRIRVLEDWKDKQPCYVLKRGNGRSYQDASTETRKLKWKTCHCNYLF
jgi:hypothetical protein